MFIEVNIHLRKVNKELEDMNIKQASGDQFVSSQLINTNNISTARPYLDEDGIPDYNFIHLVMNNGEEMLVSYNYLSLKQILEVILK